MTTNKPACPKCNYDFTDSPVKNERYHCPECGQPTRIENAYYRPSYILSTKKPILIGSVPPALLVAILIVPPLIMSTANARGNYASGFLLFTPAVYLWSFAVAFHYSQKVEAYKGPGKYRGSMKTFLMIWLLATGLLSIIFIPIWLFAFVIYAGSTM